MTPKVLTRLVPILLFSIALAGCSDSETPVQPTVDTTPPRAPVDVHVERVDDTLVISWSPNTEPDLSGYRLERSLDRGATWVELNRNITSRTSYVDELHSSVLYRVAAHDNSGNSSPYSVQVMYAAPGGGGPKNPANPA